MKQLWRRFIYIAAGVSPALCVLPMAKAFGGFVYVGAIAGTSGLVLAVALTFPVARLAFWLASLLIACGLAAMLPFSLVLLYSTIANLVAGSTSVPLREAISDLLVRLWGFGGPVACAVHFLWRAHYAPNNSFKPNPLRGSA